MPLNEIPFGGEIRSQPLNENFQYLNQKSDDIQQELNTHKANYAQHVTIDNDLLPTAEYTQFKNGLTLSLIETLSTNPVYISWINEVKQVLGYEENTVGLLFRFRIETYKNNYHTFQVVKVYNNSTSSNSRGRHLFTLTRVVNWNTWTWDTWKTSVHVIYGNGNPEGTVYGNKGQLYLDTDSGKLYTKTTLVKNYIETNVGWVEV